MSLTGVSPGSHTSLTGVWSRRALAGVSLASVSRGSGYRRLPRVPPGYGPIESRCRSHLFLGSHRVLTRVPLVSHWVSPWSRAFHRRLTCVSPGHARVSPGLAVGRSHLVWSLTEVSRGSHGVSPGSHLGLTWVSPWRRDYHRDLTCVSTSLGVGLPGVWTLTGVSPVSHFDLTWVSPASHRVLALPRSKLGLTGATRVSHRVSLGRSHRVWGPTGVSR